MKRSYNLPELFVYQLDMEELIQFKVYVDEFHLLADFFFRDGWVYGMSESGHEGWINLEADTIQGSDKRWYQRNGFEVWDWDDECFDFMEACEYLDGNYRNECSDQEAMIAFLKYAGLDQADHFEDAYNGEWGSEQAYAEDLVDEVYDLDNMMGNLSYYFDYEAFARDLFMSDYTYQDGHVFSTNW